MGTLDAADRADAPGGRRTAPTVAPTALTGRSPRWGGARVPDLSEPLLVPYTSHRDSWSVRKQTAGRENEGVTYPRTYGPLAQLAEQLTLKYPFHDTNNPVIE